MDLKAILEQKTIDTHEKYLSLHGVPPKTIKRKLSSLKKFTSFVQNNYLKEKFASIDKNRSEDIIIPRSAKASGAIVRIPAAENPLKNLNVLNIFTKKSAEADFADWPDNPYLFKESNIYQNQSNNHHPKSNGRVGTNIQNVSFFSHKDLNLKAINIHNIPPTMSTINAAHLSQPSLSEKLGVITTAANHPAAKLTNKSEITVSRAGLANIN
jgi:hypothetical protein